jgi:hypothetical protein
MIYVENIMLIMKKDLTNMNDVNILLLVFALHAHDAERSRSSCRINPF